MGNVLPNAEFAEVGRFKTELPAIRPYLGVLDPAFYTRSDLKFEAVERLQAVPAQVVRSAIVASGDSSADSESPPRFTCSICDAMSGSDSSSSGKYRSSSELQSISNTIMQASGASFLTYFSFIKVPGATEMTRHTSVGRKSVSPSSSVSPILSSDIKSASLMGCLTNFDFPCLEELAWLRYCLEVDACTLGNPFRLSTGSNDSLRLHLVLVLLENDYLHRRWSQPRVGVGIPVGDVAANRHHLLHHHIQLQHALPYIRPPYLWCRSSLLVPLPYNIYLSNIFPPPLPYLLFLPLLVSGSRSDGATESPVHDLGRRLLRAVGYDRSWNLPLEESANDRIPWRILQSVDRQDKCHHGFSFGPIFDVAYWWRRISGKLHRMLRPNPFLFLFSHHLFEALTSRLVFLSTGTFRRWIPECIVRVSHPDVHRGWLLLALGQARWKDGLKTVAEPEVQDFSFSSASWLASLQMRKSQDYIPWVQITRNDDSSCNNGREVEATKLDGSSGIPSINDNIRQLDPGSLSQLNSHWGVL
ncbi:hypothetical protein M5K25_010986 [Dendrobium thyrsiflorum]|uniref:Uncharacterized protein n=1 Tax=Dendrobium thyrsiflorum TaxID=117978 RepID=A0ABD0V8N0_DENTH